MLQKPLVLLFIGLLTMGVSCRKDPAPAPPDPPVDSLRLIGQVNVPYRFDYQGTTVGGLSSLAYRPDTRTYYLMCDDPANAQAARFYEASLDLDAEQFRAVNFTRTVPLKRPDGTPFPNAATDRNGTIDPEGLAYNPATGHLYWSSEGERTPMTNPPVLVQPFIREMNPNGDHVAEFALPDLFRMKATDIGPRRNGVFEALTLSADGKHLYAALEEPLHEDGPRADVGVGGVVRLLKFDLASRNLVAQYAYPIDKVHAAPSPAGQFSLNGVVEILPLANEKLLVMERSFAIGATPDFAVKLYEADLSAATDVSNLPALAGAAYVPVAKKLFLDVGATGISRVDNLEGMTFGPSLPNGNRILVLVADDNFNPLQVTQFLAFEVK
ncbi:MAG: esterase-like activity of phytase family protein [Cytophagales bacterium]|nr:esterase-like activity of phytase family protein [Cytophagales bacterium]